MNEAHNMLTPEARTSALRMRIVEKAEAIIRESVKPMERIEGIKILQVDGLGGMGGGHATAPAVPASPTALMNSAPSPVASSCWRARSSCARPSAATPTQSTCHGSTCAPIRQRRSSTSTSTGRACARSTTSATRHNTRVMHSTGQSGNLFSTQYRDFVEPWRRVDYVPLWSAPTVRRCGLARAVIARH